MGFKLMLNFKRPYLAKNIKEFWSRWHISLSTWFRDYLYIPLGGSKVPIPRWYFNLFIVFLISGLWHGANWTFIIWGALHGIYQLGNIVFKKFNERNFLGLQFLTDSFHVLLTFTLVGFAWIFFRANTVSDAFLICKSILTLKPGSLYIGTPASFMYGIIWILFLIVTEYITENYSKRIKVFNSSYKFIRYAGYSIIVIFIILFGVFNGGQFIYFQF